MSESPMHCADCDWRGYFREAIDHYRVTRHQLMGTSGPQDLTGWIGHCKQCQAELAISPGLPTWVQRTHCDACIFNTVKREWSKSA